MPLCFLDQFASCPFFPSLFFFSSSPHLRRPPSSHLFSCEKAEPGYPSSLLWWIEGGLSY
ncbi:hypothetical protein CCHR01_17019 [Colletotrichum chrysophilum]|uniref:Uncharacterized protein n=1 Tax=Colletotrichum chrysophilum TaxID=1836956 RepID=A0AAD9A356_9PEZI|nr:hypothetical protein CCHR01_17019 [Colletotrichum chrysophilum]